MLDFKFIGNSPHITCKSKWEGVDGYDIYFHSKFKKFLVFELFEDVVVGKSCETFLSVYEFICENVPNVENKKHQNMIFNYPTTWEPQKRGRLKWEIDEGNICRDSVKTLLLMLL